MIIGISGKIGTGKDTVGKIIQYLTATGGSNDSQIPSFKSNIAYATWSDWQIKKFAGKVKEVCSILTGIPVEDFEKEEVKNSQLGEEWNKISWSVNADNPSYDEPSIHKKHVMTVRELLQKVGTDAMRNVIHPNVWVNALMSEYKPTLEIKHKLAGEEVDEDYEPQEDDIIAVYPNIIITDVRFPNELQAVKDRGGICIRVESYICPHCGSRDTYYTTDQEDNPIRACNSCLESWEEEIEKHESETALDNTKFDYVIDNNSDIPSLIKKVHEILVKEKIL